MKRVLLSVAVICLLGGPVSADMTLTFNKTQAMALGEIGLSGTGIFQLVTDNFAEYESDTMLGEVGYIGYLKKDSSMTIGATAGELGLTGTYTGFQLFLANDNDDPWQLALYVEGLTSPAFETLVPGTGNTFVWDFGGPVTLGDDTDIGFVVRSSIGRSDVFHISAVPAPVGVVLGMLGLGVAGLKLRKFV